jgi:hypothetical protein
MKAQTKFIVVALAGLGLLFSLAACEQVTGTGGSTNQCPTTDTTFVGLGQGSGQGWFIYSGEANDPRGLCNPKGAVITKVINDSGYTFSLARPGTPFILLSSNDAVNFFNNLPVQGSWTAQIRATEAEAPLKLSFKVVWRQP